MTVNSGALSIANTGLNSLEKTLLVIDIVVLALFALYFYRRHKKLKKWKAAQATDAK